jgi:branched-chain amino acid transport system ATP-binding protein
MIDEMSLGLAPRVVEALFPVLERLNREGLAILLVEQLATFALRFSHRAYVVENARILLSGSSAKIAADTRVIESYLGRRSG